MELRGGEEEGRRIEKWVLSVCFTEFVYRVSLGK